MNEHFCQSSGRELYLHRTATLNSKDLPFLWSLQSVLASDKQQLSGLGRISFLIVEQVGYSAAISHELRFLLRLTLRPIRELWFFPKTPFIRPGCGLKLFPLFVSGFVHSAAPPCSVVGFIIFSSCNF